MAGNTFSLTHNAPSIAAALAKAPEVVLGALDNAFARGAQEMVDAERIAEPKFRSELLKSTLAGRKSSSPLEWDITALKKYGVYVDQGTTGGGRPPLEEMQNWLRIKGITPRTPNMSQLQLAKLLRLRIAAHGVKKQDFWGPTFLDKKQRVVELAEAAVFKALGGTA